MTGAGRLSLGPQSVTEIPSGLSLSILDKRASERLKIQQGQALRGDRCLQMESARQVIG